MKKSISKLIGVAVLGLLVAVVVVPTASAGAQTVTAACTFTVNPNSFRSFPGTTTVSGTAPAGSTVHVFAQTDVSQQPVEVATLVAAGNGAFSTNIVVNGPTTFTVNFTIEGSSYATGCGDPLGVFAIRIPPVEVAGSSAALAFTGSSNTPSIALIGGAAVAVGAALVVGVRRKARVRS